MYMLVIMIFGTACLMLCISVTVHFLHLLHLLVHVKLTDEYL